MSKMKNQSLLIFYNYTTLVFTSFQENWLVYSSHRTQRGNNVQRQQALPVFYSRDPRIFFGHRF